MALSDKSGKLVTMKPETYISSVQPHTENDTVISYDDKKVIEKILNGHTIQLGRILKVGEKWNHWPRVQSALRNKSCHIPVVSGYPKDHKPFIEGEPPPIRPVCGADESNNGQLSWLLSQIVNGNRTNR